MKNKTRGIIMKGVSMENKYFYEITSKSNKKFLIDLSTISHISFIDGILRLYKTEDLFYAIGVSTKTYNDLKSFLA